MNISKLLSNCVIYLALAAAAGPVLAEVLHGRVVKVVDGDTVTILTAGNQQEKIRLAEIDAPERSQPFGRKAQQMLAAMVAGSTVRVESKERDRYGRVVGRIYHDDLDVNREMVRRGGAWVYRQYLSDRTLLNDEIAAQSGRHGLWALPSAERIAPWQWRRQSKRGGGSGHSITATAPAISSECGSKRYCKQMNSCEEARFFLTQCGLSRLDRDRDGVPCESLCR